MGEIKTRFLAEELKSPFHGASINLTKAVRGQKFSRKDLTKAFKKLMPEDEYDKADTKELIDQLEIISNATEK